MASQRTRLLSWIAAAAVAGIVALVVLGWRSVTVEHVEADQAMRRFDETRAGFAGSAPMLRVDASGSVTRRAVPAEGQTTRATHLRVLAYRATQQRLVRAQVPLWFLKMKGPAVQYSLRETGVDLQRLGVTAADFERYGACLVLDETRSNGDRLLVWTE